MSALSSNTERETSSHHYVQEGHFVLSSGKHSSHYVQTASISTKPGLMTKLVARLTEKVRKNKPEILDPIEGVIAPAMGALLLGAEVARQIRLPFLFAERPSGEKHFAFRRGFSLKPKARYLVVEDVLTTGNSVKEVINLIKNHGASVSGVVSLVARGKGNLDCPFVPLEVMDLPIWDADDLPEHIKKIPPTKPGSRPNL